ncbi:hypothetical protein ACWC2K_37570 [Streptomyces chattanoogensis]|uniref:hypothetical protein n=1 Tax=Streptomyces chattanoogensis TaxID=66876 RepID=UPI00368B8B39
MAPPLSPLPDIARREAGIALVTQLYVGSPAQQPAAVKKAVSPPGASGLTPRRRPG